MTRPITRYELILFRTSTELKVTFPHFDDLADAIVEAHRYPDRESEIKDHYDHDNIVWRSDGTVTPESN
jgi:hypothetical protein